MSPNQDSAEELPFHKGQVIKVEIYGDKDADGFYHGTCGGQSGYVPSNMVSEIPIDDGDLKLDLFHQGFLPEATPTNSKGTRVSPKTQTCTGGRGHNMPHIIYVFGEMDHDGFYYADLHGHRGLVPSNYLEPLTVPTVPAPTLPSITPAVPSTAPTVPTSAPTLPSTAPTVPTSAPAVPFTAPTVPT
uniref:SH3 domain-containing protein n=1 Tax=Denticeps clupeoides TaxID=299321 RepID=A0AAY4B6Y8_9TELE